MAATLPRAHIRSAAIVTSAKVLAGVSIVVLNLWVAQHLAPASYGMFALAVTCLMLMDGVIGTALDAAVIRCIGAAPGDAASQVERAGVLMKIGGGALICVIAAAGVSLVASPEAALVTAIAGFGGTGMLTHRSVLVYLQVRERFGWYAVADFAQTTLRCALIALVLAWGYKTTTAAIAAYAVAPWLIVAVTLLIAGAGLRAKVRVSSEDFLSVVRPAGLSLATTSVGAIVARLDILLIGLTGSARETGIFAAASTLALVPTWLGAYLAPTMSGRILPYCRARRMRRFLTDVQRALVAAGVVGMVLGFTIAPALISRVLPPAYAAAAGVVPVLLGAGIAGFVTFPLVLHTLLFLSPRTYLLIDLVSLTVLIPAYLFAARRFGALGVAWITTVSAVAKAAVAQTAAVAAVRRAESEPVAV